jgi:hypothetical protein
MNALQALMAISFCTVAWAGSPAYADDSAPSNSSLETAAATTNVANIRFQAVSGNWTNSTPCNTTFFDEHTGYLKCDGFTDWSGNFTGSSHYFFNGFVNLMTGDIFGRLNETFTGEGLGKQGTFHMDEVMTISASTGVIRIESLVDGGTGGFTNLDGALRFDGTSDTSGIGNGTYSGHVGTVRRLRPRGVLR